MAFFRLEGEQEILYPNIEAERARMGLTRRQLADALGIKKDLFFLWMDGEYKIPFNFCIKLSDILGCSVDYLLSPDTVHKRWKRYRHYRGQEYEQRTDG